MTGYALVMLLIAALALNALRLHGLYRLDGLTTFLGRRDWYFDDNSPYLLKHFEGQSYVINHNGLTVWSFLFIPVAVKGFYHSTALFD